MGSMVIIDTEDVFKPHMLCFYHLHTK